MYTTAIDFLVGHEFTHRMQDLSPEAYAAYKESVKAYMGEEVWNERMARMRSIYTLNRVSASDTTLEDEIVADFTGMMVEKHDVFNKYLEANKENKGLIQTIADILRSILDKLRAITHRTTALDNVMQTLDSLMSSASAVAESTDVANSDNRNSLPSEVLAEIEAERKSIIDTAKANGTYLKAPNGKKSNLTPEQWVEVRTKRFKEWFGDWEKAARIEKLRSSENVVVPEDVNVGKYELNRESAEAYLLNELRGEYNIADTNEQVTITRKGAKKVTSHSAENIAHLKSIAVIPQMLENAIFIDEVGADKDNAQYDAYRYYVCGLRIGNEDYTVRITIGVKRGKYYYDHSLTSIEKGNLIEIAQGFTPNGGRTLPSYAESKDTRIIPILQTNSSKIVDANGEPMVVYHGTRDKFNTFIRRADIGYHFGTKGTARVKAGRGKSAIMMHTFLNSRNPLTFDKDLGSWEADYVVRELLDMGLMTDAEAKSILLLPNGQRRNSSNANKDLRTWIADKGYDGFVYPNWYESDGKLSYMVFNPNQIKSATDNVGTYDADNPDIRFLLRTIQDIKGALTNYENTLDIKPFVSTVNDVVNRGDGNAWLQNILLDYDEFGEEEFVYGIRSLLNVAGATDSDAPYTTGGARFSLREVNDRFNKELATLTEENARERILNVGTPSPILLACGIEDKPIRLYGAKLLSKVRKHGYKIDDLKNLPLAISSPIAVFEGSKKNSFAILTELRIGNSNVLVALSVGKGGHDVDFNIISSVYDKREDSVARWVKDGKMLWVDKKKALDYFSVSAPLAEAQNNQELISTTKVIQNFENPKIEPRFSLRELDAPYLDAVERGDMETAQRMVDDMAKVFGYTIRGEHGTTHKFTIFNYDYANKENSFGEGHYFTSDYDDAQDNYSSVDGPDLKQRIQLLAERMEYDPEYEDMSDEERLRIATQKLSGGENIVISAALRMDKPVVFGEDVDGEIQETYFDITESYDEETDEYEEPTGLLVDFVEALNEELSEGNYWGTKTVELWELTEFDGLTANQLRDKVINLLSDTEDNDGNFVSHNIFRNALVRMGFDGIIDNEPSIRFSNMGLSRYTKHYIVFDSNQIKLTDPVTYDDNGNVIPLSERFNPNKEDIRYSLMRPTDEEVTFDNFFDNTSAVFTLLPKSEAPQREADYESKRWDGFGVSSRYWYGEDEQGKYVVRASDHWSSYPRGANSRKAFEDNPYHRIYTQIASCRWALDMADAPGVATPRPEPRASQEEWDAYNKARKAQKAAFEDTYIDGKTMYGKAYLDDFTKWKAEPRYSFQDIPFFVDDEGDVFYFNDDTEVTDRPRNVQLLHYNLGELVPRSGVTG